MVAFILREEVYKKDAPGLEGHGELIVARLRTVPHRLFVLNILREAEESGVPIENRLLICYIMHTVHIIHTVFSSICRGKTLRRQYVTYNSFGD